MNTETISEHCGPNGFSPPAPPELCAQIHTIPEPSTFLLLLIAILCFAVVKLVRR